MGTIIEVRSVKVNLPSVVEDFYYAFESEEYERCKEIKNEFYRVYETFEEPLKKKFVRYIKKYLEEYEIDNREDLNGFFDEILNINN